MGNRYARILAAGGAAVLVAALGVPAALAAGPWTVQPGGGVRAMSGWFTATDTTTGTLLRCTSSAASGTFKSGSGLPGADAGSLSAVGVTGCVGPLTFHLQAGGLPWRVSLSSYNAAKGVVRGTIGHLHLTLSGNGCTAVIDGTRATADDGRVVFRYADGTGRLKVLATGGNLHYHDVSNDCLGVINSGDPVTLSVTYTVSPKQAITGP